MYFLSIYCLESCSSRVVLGAGEPGRVAGLTPAPHPGHVSEDQRLWKSFCTAHKDVITALGAHSQGCCHSRHFGRDRTAPRGTTIAACALQTHYPNYAFTEPTANIYFNRFLLAVLHLCSLGECVNSQARKCSHMMRISPMN